MWIDTRDCPEHFHHFEKVDGQIQCLHADGTVCEQAEYNVAEAA